MILRKHMNKDQLTTDFGYQQIPIGEKANRVAAVFSSVASRYDLMNDLMSVGIHRLWKHFLVRAAGIRQGQQVLDLAGGTGDLAKRFSEQVGREGHVYLVDINLAMLQVGRDRLLNQGILHNVSYLQTDAEALPFAENSFDCITIAFGLRNVTDKTAALRSMYHVLKPGGQLLILEFSRPLLGALKAIYDTWSFTVLPQLGEWIADDAASYQYLAESIRMHPDQETLKEMVVGAGFDRCHYYNLSNGIVALHCAWKY